MAWPWITNRRIAPSVSSPQLLSPAPLASPQPSRFLVTIEAGFEIMKNTVRNIGAGGSLQAARAEAEARREALKAERDTKLLESEFLSDVSRIDLEIAALDANILILDEREVVLQKRAREHEQARREQAKKAEVADVGKRLAHRLDAAKGLDASSLGQIPEAFTALEAADEAIFANWSELLPPAQRFGYLRLMRLEPLSPMRKQRMSAGLLRELAARAPFGLAARAEEMGRELLAELEGAPLPDRNCDSAESEEQAA